MPTYARAALRFAPRAARTAFLAAALLVALAPVSRRGSGLAFADTPSPVKAILEVDRDAYYAGDPVPIRLSVWNDGATVIEAPGGTVEKGFELLDVDGKKVPASTVPDAAGGETPKRSLQPGAFYGFARDFTLLFPRLKQPGTYRLTWSAGDLTSNAVVLRVVPRYDPAKDYVAKVETDMGPFTIEFLRKSAPIAVKTFVELASTGFYDGQVFHYVEPNRVVMSGDPTGTGLGGPGFTIPMEHPQVKMLAGTVFLRPTMQGPTNGSTFGILLAPRPELDGKQTAFGQVVDGMGVISRISEATATPKNATPPHRPLKDIRITKVTVTAKGA